MADTAAPQGTALSHASRVETMRGFLTKAETVETFRAALPKVGIDAERFVRLALTAFNKTPELYECDPQSVLSCLVVSAQSGLSPSSIAGDCYLIPFKNTKTGKKEAQFIPGYRGLMKVARRSGHVLSIDADVVREGDAFDEEKGSNARLFHKKAPPGKRGPVIAAWALAKMKGGGEQFVVMDIDELNAVKKRSKTSDWGPWKSDEAEMQKKTVLRRLCKYLPLEDEDARTVLDAAEREEAGLLTGEEYSDEPPPPAPGQTVESGPSRGRRRASPAATPPVPPVQEAQFTTPGAEEHTEGGNAFSDPPTEEEKGLVYCGPCSRKANDHVAHSKGEVCPNPEPAEPPKAKSPVPQEPPPVHVPPAMRPGIAPQGRAHPAKAPAGDDDLFQGAFAGGK